MAVHCQAACPALWQQHICKQLRCNQCNDQSCWLDKSFVQPARLIIAFIACTWTHGGHGTSKHAQDDWCMQVHSAKRMKKVADFMALEVERLPPLEGEPDQPRLFETWLPSKVIKAYSLRCKLHIACIRITTASVHHHASLLSPVTSHAPGSWYNLCPPSSDIVAE